MLGVALSAVQWVPSKELIDRSPRAGGLSYDDATFGSWHPELLPTLLVREAYGTRARDTDWMDGFYPYHEMNTFLGVLGSPWPSSAPASYRDRWVGFWVLLAGAGVVLMLGRFSIVWDVLYRVPVLGSGRIPVRYHLWLTLAVAALAGVGVDRLARPGPVRLRWAFVLIALLVVVSIPFLVTIYTPAWTEAHRWTWPYHQNRFRWLGRELVIASIRTASLALCGWIVAARLARGNDRRRRSALAWALPLLVLAELLGAHWFDAPTVDPSYWTNPPPTARWLAENPDTIRVFGMGDRSAGEPGYASEPVDFFQARDTLAWSLAPVWGLKSSGGLTPIISRRLGDYDEAANRAGVRFDLESVTHVLVGRQGAATGLASPVALGSALIYPNPEALPRARLVGRPVYVKDLESARAALLDLGTEATDRLIVEDPDHPLPPDATPSGPVTIVRERPERIELKVKPDSPAYLVLADTFDPGWTATVDGRPAPIRPAYLAFRAVFVPKGPHEIVLTYRPAGFTTGLLVTLPALLGVLLCLTSRGTRAWPGPLGGDAGWPRFWPAWYVMILAATVAASAVDLGTGGLTIDHRWRGSVHRFTWGAGVEAMRPRSQTPQ